jgi:hypothetical protein
LIFIIFGGCNIGSFALIKSSIGIVPAFLALFVKQPGIIINENLPYFYSRLKNHTLPYKVKDIDYSSATYVGITKEEIANVTEEDIIKATYKEKKLKPTKGFQVNSPPIVALAKKLGGFDEKVSRREYCERVFNFVRDEIRFGVGETICNPYQDALTLLRTGEGLCFEQSALAVTLARAGGVPSRCKIDYIKLPTFTIGIILERYGDKLESNPFWNKVFNMFGILGGPHMGAEFYIDGKWICGETALDDYVQAALGNPLSELGEDLITIGMDTKKPITLLRYGYAIPTIRFMKFLIRIPMLFLMKTLKDAEVLFNDLREDGKRIIKEAGGRDKYRIMMRKKLGLIHKSCLSNL